MIINKFLKNGVHVCDDWSRPIYYVNKNNRTYWFCDTSCGTGEPVIHYMNTGAAYDYEAEPDYPVEYTEII